MLPKLFSIYPFFFVWHSIAQSSTIRVYESKAKQNKTNQACTKTIRNKNERNERYKTGAVCFILFRMIECFSFGECYSTLVKNCAGTVFIYFT